MAQLDPQSPDRARILVLGDAGVGKTSLVHMLCRHDVLFSPGRTVGCHLDVLVHVHTKTAKPYFMEFMDVGGNIRQDRSLAVFFQNINGVILVHDVTNSKSYHNLWQWLAIFSQTVLERSRRESSPVKESATPDASGPLRETLADQDRSWMGWLGRYIPRLTAQSKQPSEMDPTSILSKSIEIELMDKKTIRVPLLLVGNKSDLLTTEQSARPRRYSLSQEFQCPSLTMSAHSAESYAKNAQAIAAFYDDVINSVRSDVRIGSVVAAHSPELRGATSFIPAGAQTAQRQQQRPLSLFRSTRKPAPILPT